MPDESSRPPDQQQPVELGTDFPRESRYEFVAILAYKLWEKRGSPIRFTGRRLVRSRTSCLCCFTGIGDDYPISE